MTLSGSRPLRPLIFKIAAHLLLPLSIINHTVAANRFGGLIEYDQLIFALTITLACYVGANSGYRCISVISLIVAIGLRGLEMLTNNHFFYEASFMAFAVVFCIAGACIYGPRPQLLRNQLVLFLSLCLPLMILQVTGASPLVFSWVTDYLHDATLTSLKSVGNLGALPVYPTLFVDLDDVQYIIYQGRPAGLMYASNALSIFIAIGYAINISIDRGSRLVIADYIISAVAVLSMSKLALVIALIITTGYLTFGSSKKRALAAKLIGLLVILLMIYLWALPGLFKINLSKEMTLTSVSLRLLDLSIAMGITDDWLFDLYSVYKPSHEYVMQEKYSGVAVLIRHNTFCFFMFAITLATIIKYKTFLQMITTRDKVYQIVLLSCLMTQFVVPFFNAASFQLILGFALFPVYRRFCRA